MKTKPYSYSAHLPSRRDCLFFGTLATFAGSRAFDVKSMATQREDKPAADATFGKAKRCVLVWLDGGPSHLEMFDPKPDASAEVRGPLGVIATKQPSIRFGEGLQQLAKRNDQFTIVRSMTSPVGEHNLATQYALSGHIPGGRAAAPAFMLPVFNKQQTAGTLPVHVAVPDFRLGGGAGLNGYLPLSSLPWSIENDPSKPGFHQALWPKGSLDINQLRRRRELLEQTSTDDLALKQAVDLLIDTTTQEVFDLTREDESTRSRYGMKSIGQSCLLARRLLEAGVPMITINNTGWDTHDRLHDRLHAGYTGAKIPVGLIPSLDQAVAALLDDLQSTGLISDTLVIVMGEFGRTPKINTQGGRDHWPRAYSVLLAGGGTQRGLTYGSSDAMGENALDLPLTPADLIATLYHLLGLDPYQRVNTPDGQQLVRVAESARIVRTLIG